MTLYVVTEGEGYAAKFRQAAADRGVADIRVVPTGDRSSALSMAVSLKITKQSPVALVIDADGGGERTRDDLLAEYDYLLRRGAPVPSKVFVVNSSATSAGGEMEPILDFARSVGQAA